MLIRQAKVIRYRGAYYVQAALPRKPGEREKVREKLQKRLEKETQEREEQQAKQRQENLEKAHEVRVRILEETPVSVRNTPVSKRPKRKREDYWERRERGRKLLEEKIIEEPTDTIKEIQERNKRIQEKTQQKKNEWLLQKKQQREEAQKKRQLNEKLEKNLRENARKQYEKNMDLWMKEVKERFPEQYEWMVFLEKGQRLKQDFPKSHKTWYQEWKRRYPKHKEPESNEWVWLRNLRPISPRNKGFEEAHKTWIKKLEQLRKKYPPTGEEKIIKTYD